MNYNLPSTQDELWRRTRPDRFDPNQSMTSSVVGDLRIDTSPSKGVHVLPLADARAHFPLLLKQSSVQEIPNFARLIEERGNEGVFVFVEPGAGNGEEVRIRFDLSLTQGSHGALRNFVVVSPDTRVRLVETVEDPGGEQAFASTRVLVGRGAKLEYLRSWNLNRKAYWHSGIHLNEGATAQVTTFARGSGISKIEEVAELAGDGADLDELFVDEAKGRFHIDAGMTVRHLAPNTRSRLKVRGVVRDKGYSLHHGNIKVIREAPGSDTYFSSRHLLLSRKGRADVIPKLEIDIDDVKAGHRATVGSVDPEAIFYLMSRGLTKEDSEGLYVEGFLTELFQRFPEMEGESRREG